MSGKIFFGILAFGNFVIREKVHHSGILIYSGKKNSGFSLFGEKSIRDFCYSGKRVRESVPIPMSRPILQNPDNPVKNFKFQQIQNTLTESFHNSEESI